MGLVKRLINTFTGGRRRPAAATTSGTTHTSSGGLSGLIRRIMR